MIGGGFGQHVAFMNNTMMIPMSALDRTHEDWSERAKDFTAWVATKVLGVESLNNLTWRDNWQDIQFPLDVPEDLLQTIKNWKGVSNLWKAEDTLMRNLEAQKVRYGEWHTYTWKWQDHLQSVETHGSGDCFFPAVSYALFGSRCAARALAAISAVKSVASGAKDRGEFSRLMAETAWADDVTIASLSCALSINIVTFQSELIETADPGTNRILFDRCVESKKHIDPQHRDFNTFAMVLNDRITKVNATNDGAKRLRVEGMHYLALLPTQQSARNLFDEACAI
jgi:hypothetical protein